MCAYVHTDEHLAVGDVFFSPIYAKQTRKNELKLPFMCDCDRGIYNGPHRM